MGFSRQKSTGVGCHCLLFLTLWGGLIGLQNSCLENPMDRGVCQAIVHGVARVGHDLVTKPAPISGDSLGQTRNLSLENTLIIHRFQLLIVDPRHHQVAHWTPSVRRVEACFSVAEGSSQVGQTFQIWNYTHLQEEKSLGVVPLSSPCSVSLLWPNGPCRGILKEGVCGDLPYTMPCSFSKVDKIISFIVEIN